MNLSCIECGEEFKTFPCRVRVAKNHTCSKKCAGKIHSKNTTGSNNPNWRGGIPISESTKNWKDNHREQWLAYMKKWREDNPDYQKVWQKENRKKCNKYHSKWLKTENGKIRRKYNDLNRRAPYGSKDDIIFLEIQNRKQHALLTCESCYKVVENGYHLDHIIPVVLGGNNKKDNLQILCPPCNMEKGKNAIDFRNEHY